MKNKVLILCMVLLLALTMVGCSNDKTDEGQGSGTGDNVSEDLGTPTDGSDDGSVVIQQYFASSAYVFDGVDEENGELMPPVKYTLEVKDGDNAYVGAINSLCNLPEGEDQDKYYTVMDPKYVVNNVTVEDGMAYVDFSSENLNGGSTTEIILIDQIVYTLANSFQEISAVQFTVDGQKVNTLMGHIDTTEAFVADYL